MPILVKVDQEMRPWECSQTDRHTHTHTDRSKWFLANVHVHVRYMSSCVRLSSVCLSVVCLSVMFVHPTKAIEIFANVFISYERSFILVFWEEEWLVGATPSRWNFGSTDPHWSKVADFQPIFGRSASAVTPSKKSSINTNRKSTMCFPMSLRWSSYVAPKSPKGGLENANLFESWPASIQVILYYAG